MAIIKVLTGATGVSRLDGKGVFLNSLSWLLVGLSKTRLLVRAVFQVFALWVSHSSAHNMEDDLLHHQKISEMKGTILFF